MHSLGVDAIVIPEMNDQFLHYNGSQSYKTDAKNRVTVKAGWRPPSGDPVYLMASTSEDVNIIKVLTAGAVQHRIEIFEDKVTDTKKLAKLKTQLKRVLRDSSINDQGKLLIPRDLAAHANISPDSEVMLSAGDSHFEIWPKDKYEELFGTVAVPEEEDEFGVF